MEKCDMDNNEIVTSVMPPHRVPGVLPKCQEDPGIWS